MPKKPARNAFYFFMKEVESLLRREEGRVFPNGMADVAPFAHPRWKLLPENEKERFENMAKAYKAKMRGTDVEQCKMDNIGNIISKRVNRTEVNDKRRQQEKREAVAKWTGKDITEERFYFINFQTLCKTENGDYLPCEMAIIEYSLSRGIIKKFHRFIEPGQIPTGYRYVCMNNSETGHQIPIENFEKADKNYTDLNIEIENFINPNGQLPECPPFYCLNSCREMSEYCLEWLHDRSRNDHYSRTTKVYVVEDLLMDLYIHGNGPKVSKSNCLDILTSHHWDYSSNTRCEYHEELECRDCSLAIVQRCAFAFSDVLAVIYEIKLTDKHLPSTAEDEDPCIILPATPLIDSDFRNYNNKPRTPACGRGQTRPDRIHKPSSQSIAYDDDMHSIFDDSDVPMKTSLRRPNVSSMAVGANVWNSMTSAIPNSSTMSSGWPSLRGPNPGRYAGGAATPNSDSAASDVDNIFGKTCIPMQRDLGAPIASLRGMMRPNRPQFQIVQPPNPVFSMRGVGQPGRIPTSLRMTGRGRNLLIGGTVVPPVGRGYAPPGMIKLQKDMSNATLNDSK